MKKLLLLALACAVPAFGMEQELDKKICLKSYDTLHETVEANDFEAVQALLNSKNFKINGQEYIHGNTPLHLASTNDNSKIVKLLLEHPAINVHLEAGRNKETPLHRACAKGHYKVVKLLLKHPYIAVNPQANGQETPLHYACTKNRYNVVKLLLESPYIKVNSLNKTKRTPLHIACLNGHYNIVRLLLEHPDIKVNLQERFDHAPLHYACYNNHHEIVKLLLQHPDIKINLLGFSSHAPLHYACKNDHHKIVKLLLQHPDIKVNLQNCWKVIPIKKRSLDIFSLFLEHGFGDDDVFKTRETTLTCPTNGNKLSFYELMLNLNEVYNAEFKDLNKEHFLYIRTALIALYYSTAQCSSLSNQFINPYYNSLAQTYKSLKNSTILLNDTPLLTACLNKLSFLERNENQRGYS